MNASEREENQRRQAVRDEIANNVRAQIAKRRTFAVKVAQAVGMNKNTLSSRLNGHTAFTTDELYRIADHLDASVIDLLVVDAASDLRKQHPACITEMADQAA